MTGAIPAFTEYAALAGAVLWWTLIGRIEYLRLSGRLAPDTFTLFSHQGNNPRRGYLERSAWSYRLALTNLSSAYNDGAVVVLVWLVRLAALAMLPGMALMLLHPAATPAKTS